MALVIPTLYRNQLQCKNLKTGTFSRLYSSYILRSPPPLSHSHSSSAGWPWSSLSSPQPERRTHGCRGCGPGCVAHCSCPEMAAVRWPGHHPGIFWSNPALMSGGPWPWGSRLRRSAGSGRILRGIIKFNFVSFLKPLFSSPMKKTREKTFHTLSVYHKI